MELRNNRYIQYYKTGRSVKGEKYLKSVAVHLIRAIRVPKKIKSAFIHLIRVIRVPKELLYPDKIFGLTNKRNTKITPDCQRFFIF